MQTTVNQNAKRESWIKAAATALLVVLSLGLFVFAVAFSRFPEMAFYGHGLGQWMRALTSLLALVLATAVVWFFRRVIGKRSVASLGLTLQPRWWLQLLGGAALGLGLFAVFIALQYGFGLVEFTGTLWQTMQYTAIPRHLLVGLIAFIVVGINEELFFRGYLYTLLKERHGWTAAVVGSTLLFSIIHGMEPGFSSLVFLNILLIGAVFLLLRERTGGLWLPIGLHWMWDYAQNYLFAVSTSEVNPQGLLNFFQRAGVYGPERTVTTTVLFALLFIGLVYPRLRTHKPEYRQVWSRRLTRHRLEADERLR